MLTITDATEIAEQIQRSPAMSANTIQAIYTIVSPFTACNHGQYKLAPSLL